MNITIRNDSDAPIYVQIKEQLKESIFRGEIQPLEQLPSIRQLAKDLRISVITTKKAYDELEREGYVHSVPGKGVFVAKRDPQLQRTEHRHQIEEKLREALHLATYAELSAEELVDILYALEKEGKEDAE